MTNDEHKLTNDANSDVEREIRQGRKFSTREAMARMAGPGAMKGASPVSPVQQAETEIGNWLNDNLADPCGALKVVMHRQLKGSEPLLKNVGQPLSALADFCGSLLESDYLLQEVVREADIEWGRAMGERPHFERTGIAPDLGDPYTYESVRKALGDAHKLLKGST
jgi:hypothetical protein